MRTCKLFLIHMFRLYAGDGILTKFRPLGSVNIPTELASSNEFIGLYYVSSCFSILYSICMLLFLFQKVMSCRCLLRGGITYQPIRLILGIIFQSGNRGGWRGQTVCLLSD